MASELEIKSPNINGDIHTSLDVFQGFPIPKLKRLEIIDEDSWEDVTLELVLYWKTQYTRVVKCGGSGDLGRDVIAYNQNGEWENFQCKHYNKPITLDESIREIGKLIYYAYIKEYTVPQKYYFVSPKGVSTQLLNCLMDTGKLKDELLKRWNKQCRSKITTKKKIELTADLLSYIDKYIAFEIFDHISPLQIIELHSNTPYHYVRFGALTRKRPKPEEPPLKVEDSELIYTSELLRAFSDAEANHNITGQNLSEFPEYKDEYNSARKNYYSAEGLEKFSRDWLPPDSYKELLDECYEAISPTVLSIHENGYQRYLRTSAHISTVDFASHPLHHYIKIQDKKGFCHHLVNEKKIKWIR